MYQEYQECREEEQMFDCGNGECGFSFWACDGTYDCNTNRDERNLGCCSAIESQYEMNQLDQGQWGHKSELPIEWFPSSLIKYFMPQGSNAWKLWNYVSYSELVFIFSKKRVLNSLKAADW